MKHFDVVQMNRPNRELDFTPQGFQKPKNSLWEWVLAIVVVILFWWVVFSIIFPETATAKTLEAKDCMTNECVIRIVCGEETDYTNVREICHE